ncbi:hypothetical protein UCDDS831_g04876 [Diplodia seriata]|uniref:DUF7918 domain-containing protein n=1 Tax=Diplodia seriata TaxID=420778 RepID=A0A0G2EB95_9PEZI|nr:hypothetical protein UCDDS831_g04876 [Diplodia seriata]
MAIISDIPGLKVEVRVHGQALDEFPSDDEPDTSDTATRYIEATSGVEFTVRITYDEALDPRYKSYDIHSRLELDGKHADRRNTERKDLIGKERKEVNYYGSRSFENGKWYFRTMAFSQINIVESLTAEEARELVRRLKDQQGARQSPPPETKQEVKQEIKEEFDQGKRPSDAIVVDLGSEDSDVEITGVRKRKRLRTSGPVEVIDLSDD